MKVMLVPSSIAVAGEQPSQYLVSYLINDSVAVDAGSLGLYGTPAMQAKVKHVLLSHTHIDHTATLPIFLENAYEAKADCVTVYGSEAVIASLRQDIFNDRTWPDFIALSEGPRPFLRLQQLQPGKSIELQGLRITPIEVDHVVPTLGFLVEEGACSVLIASDTGPTTRLWQVADATPGLKAVFLEAAFPNHMGPLANASKHLTPALFGAEVRKLSRPVRIIAVHIKARFRAQILRELDALGIPELEIGQFGQEYTWA